MKTSTDLFPVVQDYLVLLTKIKTATGPRQAANIRQQADRLYSAMSRSAQKQVDEAEQQSKKGVV